MSKFMGEGGAAPGGVRQENGGAASGGSARLGGVMHRRGAKSQTKGAAAGGAPGTSGTRTENRFQGTVLCQISLDQLGGAAPRGAPYIYIYIYIVFQSFFRRCSRVSL